MDEDLLLSKSISTEERNQLPDEDFAGPGRTFPIKEGTVAAAWDLSGHASNPEEVRSKIIEIARRKGLVSELPETAMQSIHKSFDSNDFINLFIPLHKAFEETSDGVIIEGYVSMGTRDREGDLAEPQAFAKSLPTYLENPVVLYNHNQNIVIGKTLSAMIDNIGLFARALITEQPYVDKIKKGMLNAFSFVGIAKRGYIKKNQDGTNTRVFTEIDLCEASVVPVPAHSGAVFRVAKSLNEFITNEEPMNEGLEELQKSMAAIQESLKTLSETVVTAMAPMGDVAKALTTPKAPETSITPDAQVRKGLVRQPNNPSDKMTLGTVIKSLSEGDTTVLKSLSKPEDEITSDERAIKLQLTKALLFPNSAIA